MTNKDNSEKERLLKITLEEYILTLEKIEKSMSIDDDSLTDTFLFGIITAFIGVSFPNYLEQMTEAVKNSDGIKRTASSVKEVLYKAKEDLKDR